VVSVTAVISSCNRLHNAPRIWEALRAQSHPCEAIWFFYNGKEAIARGDLPPFERSIVSDSADDHYTRYAVALAAQTEWVFILDDDCVPGSRWIENCLELSKQRDGIFAPVGARIARADFAEGPYTHDSEVSRVKRAQRRVPIEVDVPFHSFFLRRRHLAAIFSEPLGVGLRDGETVPILGQEDVILAARVWRRHRVGVWLPSFPEPELRGNDEEVNETAHAAWVNRKTFGTDRLAALRYEASLGWRPRLMRGPLWQQWWRRQRTKVKLKSEVPL